MTKFDRIVFFNKTCFIITLLFLSHRVFAQKQLPPLPVKDLAQKHSIFYQKPAPDFFEGALLGNGGMGVVVTTRPDAIVLYFGHNNVWDIRIAENNKKELGTFNYVFEKVKNIPSTLKDLTDDPWYSQYNKMSGENYSKPYPRPFPCGSVLLGFDRRKTQLLGHTLDISNGLCTVKLLTADKKEIFLQLFTEMENDQLNIRLVDENGNPQKNIFDRIKLMPDPSTPKNFPKYTGQEDLGNGVLSFRQTLPSQEPNSYNTQQGHLKEKAFRLSLKINSSLTKRARVNWSGNTENMPLLEAALAPSSSFTAVVSLQEGLDSLVEQGLASIENPDFNRFSTELNNSTEVWNKYWEKSAVKLSDDFLEQIWYRNLYFFNCAVKDGVACPGLFANWSYNNIGTAWHGDYHMNYNTQQPFWMTFSSNHLEKNLAYVNLIETLMPVSRKWAKEYYELPGAYFPHSAYPVEMTMNPYPLPDWGWEISETPWAVQGLWWHYLYSGDLLFLKNRAYGPIKAAVEFLTAYMKRSEAKGGERWIDTDYHIFPTVPPELYGLRPGFKYNYDCTIDLTLTKFMFHAFKQANSLLGTSKTEKKLLTDIDQILNHYPAYPSTKSEEYGDIFVSVPEEHDKIVYNVPTSLASVFPGEDHGLHSDKATFQKLKNTYYNQQNEGGNDLVFMNLQASRIGLLDIEQFKRQINYSLLPNGTATNMIMQTMGRYNDMTEYGYMSRMGIWFENFALPAVINECLMQSYNGTIRLFPNWPSEKDAEFNSLRATGAFLVSAAQSKGTVNQITIISEKGHNLRLMVPWGAKGTITSPSGKIKITTDILSLKTSPGERLILTPY
jgi:alpha-L-fucosidase 2